MDTIWNENDLDLLDREPFINQLMQIVDGRTNAEQGLSFAIDGEWGVGKSTVLTMFEQRAQKENIVFHYNAWENDFYEEPLIAMLSVFADSLRNFETNAEKTKYFKRGLLKKVAEALFCVSGQLSKHLIGVDVVDFARQVKNEMEKIESAKYNEVKIDNKIILKSSLKAIKEQLNKLTDITKIIVVVDELDRCLPEYAIKVLERIHHIFLGMKGCVVVVSVDKNQLENTIIKIFGDKIDLNSYLKKFLDFSINLDYGNLNVKFSNLLENYMKLFSSKIDNTEFALEKEWIIELFKGIRMRECLNILSKIILIHKTFIAPKHSNCDISIMFFELMSTIALCYYKLTPSQLFTESSTLNNEQKRFYNYFDKYKEFIEQRRVIQDGHPIYLNLIQYFNQLGALIIWYFAELTPFDYIFEENRIYFTNNINIVQEYFDYLNIIQ